MTSIGIRIDLGGLFLLLGLCLFGCGADGTDVAGNTTTFLRPSRAVPVKLAVLTSHGNLVDPSGQTVETASNGALTQTLAVGRPIQVQTGFAPPNTIATTLGDPPLGHLPYDSRTLSATRNEPDFFEWRNLRFTSLSRRTIPAGGSGSSYLGNHELTFTLDPPPEIDKIAIEDRLGQTTEFSAPITFTARVTRTPETTNSEFMINGTPFDLVPDLLTGIVVEVPAMLGDYQLSSRSTYVPSDESAPEDETYEITIPVRALQFAKAFEPLIVAPSQPIEISNAFGWNTEDPVEDARWKVTISDVFGGSVGTFEGEGTEIDLLVSRSGNNLLAATNSEHQEMVLLPEGCGLAEQVREQAIEQAQNPATAAANDETLFLFYQVTASGVAVNTADAYRYYLHSSQRAVPAVRISNLEIFPNPFFPDPPSVPEEARRPAEIYAEIDTEGVDSVRCSRPLSVPTPMRSWRIGMATITMGTRLNLRYFRLRF